MTFWLKSAWFLFVAVLFSFGATTEIDLPGAYMDAVNPDYAVLNLLTRDSGIIGWFLPGNLLFGRFLILGGLYHGALPLYVGLPSYALFGTGIVGIRLTNLLFGLIVLGSTFAFLRSFRVQPFIVVVVLAAFALDAGLIFSFRTQFYITLLPVAFLLASIAIIEAQGDAARRRAFCLAGMLAGIACYGYFIYAFLVPAAFLHTVWRARATVAPAAFLGYWLAGAVLGASPYIVGFVLLGIAAGGFTEFWQFITNALTALDVQSSLTVAGRLKLFADFVVSTVLDVGPATMMLQASVPSFSPQLKLILLLGLPAAALVLSLALKRTSPGLYVVLALVAGFLVLVLTFGGRLWLQHAALLMPLLYAALALALDWLGRRCLPAPRAMALLVVLPLMFVNAVDTQAIFQRLRATGGVGLASNASTQLAEDAMRMPAVSRFFFPDWGVFMPFAMITRGGIPYSTDFTPANAKATLCLGQDAVVVLTGNAPMTRVSEWMVAVGGEAPVLTSYTQRDGVLVLTSARWKASPRREACT